MYSNPSPSYRSISLLSSFTFTHIHSLFTVTTLPLSYRLAIPPLISATLRQRYHNYNPLLSRTTSFNLSRIQLVNLTRHESHYHNLWAHISTIIHINRIYLARHEHLITDQERITTRYVTMGTCVLSCIYLLALIYLYYIYLINIVYTTHLYSSVPQCI